MNNALTNTDPEHLCDSKHDDSLDRVAFELRWVVESKEVDVNDAEKQQEKAVCYSTMSHVAE